MYQEGKQRSLPRGLHPPGGGGQLLTGLTSQCSGLKHTPPGPGSVAVCSVALAPGGLHPPPLAGLLGPHKEERDCCRRARDFPVACMAANATGVGGPLHEGQRCPPLSPVTRLQPKQLSREKEQGCTTSHASTTLPMRRVSASPDMPGQTDRQMAEAENRARTTVSTQWPKTPHRRRPLPGPGQWWWESVGLLAGLVNDISGPRPCAQGLSPSWPQSGRLAINVENYCSLGDYQKEQKNYSMTLTMY